jgi:superfamily II DNA/RNA helicase
MLLCVGSGKTLCYVLPVLETLSRRMLMPRIGAIVLLPTQELAIQVFLDFVIYIVRLFSLYAGSWRVSIICRYIFFNE